MSGFIEYQASGASELGGRTDVVFTWTAAQSMLPLVRRVVADIVAHSEQLARLEPERDRLDNLRHHLDWPARSRRYQVTEEIGKLRTELQTALAELESLGVVTLNATVCLIGFPTIVNSQRAYFSWKPGEEGVDYWQFTDGMRRRPVPPAWKDAEPATRSR